jgi:hypothetical protein
LALLPSSCQSTAMSNESHGPQTAASKPVAPPPRRGGGCLIAAGVILGPVAGVLAGEPSIGLVAGLALGVGGAAAMYVIDRRQQ